MRRLIGATACAALLALTGCGGSGGKVDPAKLTPEQEAKLKAEQQKADSEESGDAMNAQVGTKKKK